MRGWCREALDDEGWAAYHWFDPSRGTQRIVDDLGALAGLGFHAAIGAVRDVWQVAPLEAIGAEVIPAVADF